VESVIDILSAYLGHGTCVWKEDMGAMRREGSSKESVFRRVVRVVNGEPYDADVKVFLCVGEDDICHRGHYECLYIS
jgi:hypothetical protein